MVLAARRAFRTLPYSRANPSIVANPPSTATCHCSNRHRRPPGTMGNLFPTYRLGSAIRAASGPLTRPVARGKPWPRPRKGILRADPDGIRVDNGSRSSPSGQRGAGPGQTENRLSPSPASCGHRGHDRARADQSGAACQAPKVAADGLGRWDPPADAVASGKPARPQNTAPNGQSPPGEINNWEPRRMAREQEKCCRAGRGNGIDPGARGTARQGVRAAPGAVPPKAVSRSAQAAGGPPMPPRVRRPPLLLHSALNHTKITFAR